VQTHAPKDQKKRSSTKKIKSFIPLEVHTFIRQPGNQLRTTRENVDFLRKYDIDHDNGKSVTMNSSAALRRELKGHFQLAWSPRHIIKYFDLKYLTPRGHPLAPLFRDRCKKAATEQPLWLHVTSRGGPPAVVRHTASRRFKAAILKGLEEMGYTPNGQAVGGNREIRGTLWISIFDPVKAANLPAAKIGKLIAEDLHANYSTEIRR
jgi:hypothetical protein